MEEDQEGDRYSVAYDEEEPHELVMHDVYVALEWSSMIDAHA